MKWLTKVTSRFFWMASTRVRSIEATVMELMTSGAVDDTVESQRRLDEDDIAVVISLRLSHHLLSFESLLNIFPFLAHFIFRTWHLTPTRSSLVLFIIQFHCLPVLINTSLEFKGFWLKLCTFYMSFMVTIRLILAFSKRSRFWKYSSCALSATEAMKIVLRNLGQLSRHLATQSAFVALRPL